MTKDRRVLLFKLFLAAVALLFFIVPDAITSPEIEQRVLAGVLGIDRTETGYSLTAQVVVPRRASEGEPPQEVVTAEGGSIPEGIDKLNRALGRQIELGHCGVIVLGDMPDTAGLDYLLAGSILTTGTYLVHAENAADFIESVKGMSASAVTGLDGYINYSTASSSAATNHLLQFLSETASPSRTSYMPILEADADEESPSGQGAGGAKAAAAGGQNGAPGGGGGQSGGEKKTTTIRSAENTAVYVDGKLTGTFGEKETRGLAWTDRETSRGYVGLDRFEAGGRDRGGVYAQLTSKSAKLEPYFEDGRPHVRFKIRAKLRLDDKHKLHLLAQEMNETAAVSVMEEAFADLIRSEIGAALIKAFELGADPFGIRTAFYRYAHRGYAAYDKAAFAADVVTEYDVRVHIE